MKRRTHATNAAPSGATVLQGDGSNATLSSQDAPRSIVAKCSKVDMATAELIQDLRKVMGPYTATNLKEKRSNRMKDYTSVASSLPLHQVPYYRGIHCRYEMPSYELPPLTRKMKLSKDVILYIEAPGTYHIEGKRGRNYM